MNIPENIFNNLTEGQKEAIETARSPEELNALAEECGIELSLDQLEGVSGGSIPCLRHGQTPHTQGIL